MVEYIKINKADNVAVAVHDLHVGDTVRLEQDDSENICLEIVENIPAGHKFALVPIKMGGNVIKYGFPIGHVTKDILQGALIDHNSLKTNLEGLLEYTYAPQLTEIPDSSLRRSFKGFRRASSKVGIRNQIWIIPTVGCVN